MNHLKFVVMYTAPSGHSERDDDANKCENDVADGGECGRCYAAPEIDADLHREVDEPHERGDCCTGVD